MTICSKLGLTSDIVLNNVYSLSNFTPYPAQRIAAAAVVHPPDTESIYKLQQAPQKNSLPFHIVKYPKNNLIFKLQPDDPFLEQFDFKRNLHYWEFHQDLTSSDSLHRNYDIFKDKMVEMMKLADMDQMLYADNAEDDKHEEEELKVLRKKIKMQTQKQVTTVQPNGVVKSS